MIEVKEPDAGFWWTLQRLNNRKHIVEVIDRQGKKHVITLGSEKRIGLSTYRRDYAFTKPVVDTPPPPDVPPSADPFAHIEVRMPPRTTLRFTRRRWR